MTVGERIPKPLSLWERLREGTRHRRVGGEWLGWSHPAPAHAGIYPSP